MTAQDLDRKCFNSTFMEKFKNRVMETELKLLGIQQGKEFNSNFDSIDLKWGKKYCGLDLEKALANSIVLDNLHDKRICVKRE